MQGSAEGEKGRMTHENHTCTCATDLTGVREVLARHEGDPGALLAVLQQVQKEYGYLPEDAIREIARARGVPLSQVFGVVTFYSQFRLAPRGRTEVRICKGTACYVAGATQISEALEREYGINEGETTADGALSIEAVACLGCCGLAPVMMVEEEAHGQVDGPEAVRVVTSAVRDTEASS